MRKLLFFTLTLNGGGMERLLVDIVNNLDRSRYDITVQTFYDMGVYREQLAEDIHYKTVVPERNDLLRRVKGRLLWMVLPHQVVYDRFIRDGYDIEIAFVEGIPVKLLGIKKRECQKRLTWVHTDLLNNHYTYRFFHNLASERKAYLNFDQVICVSESARQGVEARFGKMKNVLVRNNFIDEAYILSQSLKETEVYPRTEKLRIVSVGRLVTQKGYDRLLRVIKRLKETDRKIELWIFGEGDDRKQLEEYIEKTNLESEVRLWGFMENPYPYLKQCDLFVLSSRSEGFGLALAEAMLLGLPVLSTRVSGPDEILAGGKYGMLVDNDEEALFNGIAKLYDNKDLRSFYATRSIERVDYFTKKQRMEDIERLFIQ